MAKEPPPLPATPPGPEPLNPAAHDQKGSDRPEGGGEGQGTDAQSGTPDVFISYASQDAALANDIVHTLERNNLRCWIAPRDVTPGGHYADAIIGAISGAKTLVLVLSDSALASKHVGKEIERASSKGRAIIALRTTATPLTPAFEYFLSESQWIDVGPGGIAGISAKLVEAVRSHLTPGTSSIPSKPLTLDRKLISSKRRWIAIASAAVLALVLAYVVAPKFWLAKHAPAEQPATTATPTATISDKSIAVLPFVDMSEKHDQEYFSDGLSEELIDHLAHSPDLKVIARTSSFAFKGKNEDMRIIATKLGVANLLEGSVRKSGGALRITVQLIRASDGVHRWSETYDRKLIDIFKVQDEISATVAKALNVALSTPPTMNSPPASMGTTNLEVYNLFLQGNFLFARSGTGDLGRAVERFRQAVTLEPNFAMAWARLAQVYGWQGSQGELDAAEAENKGRDAAQRALAIDPNCAEAYYARGNIFRLVAGNWSAAQADYEKAVALDPHSVAGEYSQGYIFDLRGAMSGRFDEHIDWARHHMERNPLDTDAMYFLGLSQQSPGHLVESVATFRKLLELNPNYAYAWAQYGMSLLYLGKSVEALAMTEKETDRAAKLAVTTLIYWSMNRRADSDSALAELERGYAASSQYLIAAVHAYRDEKDAAFTWLDRAYHQRRGNLEYLKSDLALNKLHGDPRFKAFLRKMNLPE